jgi:hypothetical protein
MTQISQMNTAKYVHPGTIVDAYTRKGLLAEAYAYGSARLDGSGSGCPVYLDRLDAQESSQDNGSFTFHIDTMKSSYVAVYCETGYAARTETTNDNSRNRTRVQPDPITLYPVSVQGASSVDVATVAIARDLMGLRANFSYYRDANQDAFSGALNSRFSASDKKIVGDILKMPSHGVPGQFTPAPSGPRTEVADANVAFVAIASDLNNVHSDLNYYAKVEKSGYSEALKSRFSNQEREIIESIRTRPEPSHREN